jgi:hypothetical protein
MAGTFWAFSAATMRRLMSWNWRSVGFSSRPGMSSTVITIRRAGSGGSAAVAGADRANKVTSNGAIATSSNDRRELRMPLFNN